MMRWPVETVSVFESLSRCLPGECEQSRRQSFPARTFGQQDVEVPAWHRQPIGPVVPAAFLPQWQAWTAAGRLKSSAPPQK